jgi:phosphatidylserine decarboxylase
MKHSGKAMRAALKLIFWTLVAVGAVGVIGLCATVLGAVLAVVATALGVLWILFALFTLYFFRDPTAKTPSAAGLVVSPGHGKVDVIDQLTESQFMNGPCHRISIFLSVIDIHVQNAPVAGKVAYLKHTEGKFINALKIDSAIHNENVLIGFESSEAAGEKIGLRLIAGVLARRIVPFVQVGDVMERGDRISLIQFGSRCDLYLPLHYKIQVKLGDKVVGGETIMAKK